MPQVRKIYEVEETLKQHIVSEIESGVFSQMEAAREYGFSRASIQKWLKQYGKLRIETQTVRVVMKSEKEKIKELEAALGEAHLELRFHKKLMEVMKRDYGIDIKKKLTTEQLESLKKKASK